MAVKIRLLRMGKIRQPQYRIVVADSRTKRDGRAIEYVGIYHPKEDPSRIEVKSDRVQYWLGVGAQPSDPVRAILSKTGDWQKFKGLPAPEPLKVAAPKRDKNALYEAEAKSVEVEDTKPETPKKKAAKKTESAKSAKADKAEAKDDKAAEAKTEAKADKAEAKSAEAKDDKASESENTTETAKES